MKQRHTINTLLATALFAALGATLIHAQSAEDRRIIALVETLDGPDGGVREQSKAELRRLGTNAVPVIVRMLHAPPASLQTNRETRPEGLESLPIRLDPGADPILAALKACLVLGPQAEGATPALSRLLVREPSMHVAMALAALGERALPAVCCLLTNRNEDTRFFSLLALKRICNDHLAAQRTENASAHKLTSFASWLPAGTLDALVQNLTNHDLRLRTASAWTLGALGPGAEKAVPALRHALADEEPMVRGQAEQALQRITRADLAGSPASASSARIQAQNRPR